MVVSCLLLLWHNLLKMFLQGASFHTCSYLSNMPQPRLKRSYFQMYFTKWVNINKDWCLWWMERQGALTNCSLMTKRQAHDEKEAFTFPPCQQHSKCLPAAGTSSRNPLDYWVCVTERRSPQLTTCKEMEGDDIHQTFTWPFEPALGQSMRNSKQFSKNVS